MISIWHYAQGLAFAATKQMEAAHKEQAALETIVAGSDPERKIMGRVTASDLLSIAPHVVAGELAAKHDKATEAVQRLKKAVPIQDQLQHNEPPPWYYPVRQVFGAVLLMADRAAKAEAAYQEDLKHNPKNGWSSFGLAQNRHGKGNTGKVKLAEEEFRKTWTRTDVMLSASRFWAVFIL